METLIALAMTMSLTSAMAATGTLKGSCLITQNGKTSTFNINVASRDEVAISNAYVVEIPIKNTYNDRYTIVAINTAGALYDWNAVRDQIAIQIGTYKYVCNPPILQEGGEFSGRRCDRPAGWVTLAGIDRINAPKDGDTLSLDLESEQITFSCKASFKEL